MMKSLKRFMAERRLGLDSSLPLALLDRFRTWSLRTLIVGTALGGVNYAVWNFSAMPKLTHYRNPSEVDKASHVGYSSEVLSYQRFVGKPGDGKRSG
jgi:hypothetical protein